MGLAGPRNKQRISADPNNLHWSRDTNKFGYKMLANMGWAPGKGLGLNEDGGQEHVKIRLKENNFGIGANRKNIDNWLENSDAFTRLLQELNERVAQDGNKDSSGGESGSQSEEKEERPKKRKIKKKVEYSNEDEGKKSKKEKKEKKDKKDKTAKKEKKKMKKESSESGSGSDEGSKPTSAIPSESDAPSAASIRLASRTKFLRNKRLATSQSGDRLNEILGIKSGSNMPTFSATASPSPAPEERDYKETVSGTGVQLKVNNMNTQEYFAMRMKGLRVGGIAASGLGECW
ncbi:hypothetical protein BC938DRAFT_483002, partial [Jimgerdemannia flammicorona]